MRTRSLIVRKVILLTTVLLFTGAGCNIRFVSSKAQDGGMFRSDDYAETWTQKSYVGQKGKQTLRNDNAFVTGIFVSPVNAESLTMTTFNAGIYRSRDNGETWTAIRPAGYYPTFAYDPITSVIQYTATGPTILKSTDDGATWNSVYYDTRGNSVTSVSVNPTHPSTIYAGTSAGLFVQSDNGGQDWRTVTTFPEAIRSIEIRPNQSTIVFVTMANSGIQRSTDGGATFTSLDAGMSLFGGAKQIHSFFFSPVNTDQIYLATAYGVLRSSDNGSTWEALKTLVPPSSVSVQNVATDVKNEKIIYFTVGHLLHKSEDNGATWRTIETVPTGRLISRLAVNPDKPGMLYVGTYGAK